MTRAQLVALGKKGGAAGQLAVARALHSQRPTYAPSASQSFPLQPAVGIGAPSVFYGPTRALHPGAPILRQYKP